MSKSVAVFLAEGTEEMEFSITYDVLVRGGVHVQSVYVPAPGAPAAPEGGLLRGSRGIKLGADTTLADFLAAGGVDKYDALVVPGGNAGAQTISQDKAVQAQLQKAFADHKLVATVCAGSLAPLAAGIAKSQPITSHPSVKDKLAGTYAYEEKPVVVAGNLISSRGPGTSFSFALAILEHLRGAEVRQQVAGPMMLERL